MEFLTHFLFGTGQYHQAVFPIAAALMAGGMLGSSAMNVWGNNKTVDMPKESIETTRSREMLREFGSSGVTPWGYNFHQGYDQPLGSYDMSGLESAGQGKLSGMLTSGLPGIFGTGTDQLSQFLTTDAFDPNAGGVYSGLTAGLDYNSDLAVDKAKNDASFMGNLYSTHAARAMGDIRAQTENAKSGILGNLYQNWMQNKLGAIGTAINAGGVEQGLDLGLVGASQQYGGLGRSLQDQKFKDLYAAWQNQRSAEMQPINALNSVMGNPGTGTPPIPIQSPWSGLLNTATQMGGYLYGQKMGNDSQSAMMDKLALIMQGGGPK